MEDTVSIHPAFIDQKDLNRNEIHFFRVFDGHGCSHAAMKCTDRLHEIVLEEIEGGEVQWSGRERWNGALSVWKEVKETGDDDGSTRCRCEVRTPQCDIADPNGSNSYLLSSEKLGQQNHHR